MGQSAVLSRDKGRSMIELSGQIPYMVCFCWVWLKMLSIKEHIQMGWISGSKMPIMRVLLSSVIRNRIVFCPSLKTKQTRNSQTSFPHLKKKNKNKRRKTQPKTLPTWLSVLFKRKPSLRTLLKPKPPWGPALRHRGLFPQKERALLTACRALVPGNDTSSGTDAGLTVWRGQSWENACVY